MLINVEIEDQYSKFNSCPQNLPLTRIAQLQNSRMWSRELVKMMLPLGAAIFLQICECKC